MDWARHRRPKTDWQHLLEQGRGARSIVQSEGYARAPRRTLPRGGPMEEPPKMTILLFTASFVGKKCLQNRKILIQSAVILIYFGH